VQGAHLLEVVRVEVIPVDLPQLLLPAEVPGEDAHSAQVGVQLGSEDDDARRRQSGPGAIRHTVAAQRESGLARWNGHLVRILQAQFHYGGIVLSQGLRHLDAKTRVIHQTCNWKRQGTTGRMINID